MSPMRQLNSWWVVEVVIEQKRRQLGMICLCQAVEVEEYWGYVYAWVQMQFDVSRRMKWLPLYRLPLDLSKGLLKSVDDCMVCSTWCRGVEVIERSMRYLSRMCRRLGLSVRLDCGSVSSTFLQRNFVFRGVLWIRCLGDLLHQWWTRFWHQFVTIDCFSCTLNRP